ncbi:MAG: hypothetical protein P1P64_04300 [Treponemataceae bacterium]
MEIQQLKCWIVFLHFEVLNMGQISGYEEKIQELVEEFFNLPKDSLDYSSKRETIRNKLLTILYKHYKTIYSDAIEKIAGTMALKVIACLRSYKVESKTPFLHYLNVSIKNAISYEKDFEFSSVFSAPQKTKRLWKKLCRIAGFKQIDIHDTKAMYKLGLSLAKKDDDINNAIRYGCTKKVRYLFEDKNGKSKNMLDTTDVDTYNPDEEFYISDQNPESFLDKLEKSEIVQFQLQKIDNLFSKKQDRVKDYLSNLLTLKFYTPLLEARDILNISLDFLFIDKELLESLEYKDKVSEKLPTQEEIAKKFGRDKTDASRTLNTFLKELKKVLVIE